MRRKSIKLIIKLVEKFYNEILSQIEKTQAKKRGRPRKYSDLLILSLAIIKEMLSLSLREALSIGEDYFDEILSLRDFHYRLAKLEEVVKLLIKKTHDVIQKDIKSVIVDGTGFGHKKEGYLNWMRGTHIRRVR